MMFGEQDSNYFNMLKHPSFYTDVRNLNCLSYTCYKASPSGNCGSEYP